MRNLMIIMDVNGVMGCSKEYLHHNHPGRPLNVLPWVCNDARIFQNFVLNSNRLDDQKTAHYMRGRFTSWALRKFFDGLWGKPSLCTDNNNYAIVSEYGVDDFLTAVKHRQIPYKVVTQDEIDDCVLPLFYKPDLHATHWFMGGVTTIKKLIGKHLANRCVFDNLIVIQLQQEVDGDLVMHQESFAAMLDSNFTLHSELQNKNVKIMRFKPISTAK